MATGVRITGSTRKGDPAIDRTPASGRRTLDRTRIVTTAVALIDEEGVSALSMRHLGATLGVEAMSLYRYVVSRDALLDAVVDQLMAELQADPEVRLTPEAGWEDFLTRLAHGIRRMALAHPRGFTLVATRPTVAPFVRPPLRTLAWVETFLAALGAEGFAPPACVVAYHRFSSWLLGHLLLEVGPSDPVVPLDASALDGALSAYPHIHQLDVELTDADRAADAGFAAALDQLIERVAELHSA